MNKASKQAKKKVKLDFYNNFQHFLLKSRSFIFQYPIKISLGKINYIIYFSNTRAFS